MATNPVEQFVIKPYVPLDINGIDISFTNSSLWMGVCVLLSVTFLILAARQKAMVPGRLQMFAEMIYEMVANMVRENTGDSPEARKFFPFIFTLFILVLMGNLMGMFPESFTYTSHIAVTGALALVVFAMVIVLGLVRHGFHFFSLFVPPGVPKLMWPLIIPIEVLSFLVRPLTLSVRLFANMMAGHLMLEVFAGFSVMMGVGFGIAPMLFNSVMIGFEFMIAYLQAYVFAILSCIYLKDTIELH